MIDLRQLANEPENIEFTLNVLKHCNFHPDRESYIRQTEEGFFGMRAPMAALAKLIQPALYVEIGVGRAYSMAMVAMRCNHKSMEIVGFDNWEEFSWSKDCTTPSSPELVYSQLFDNLNFMGNISLYTGKSAVIVPEWMVANPNTKAQLISVDAEHTTQAKLRDWDNAIKMLDKDGVLVVYGLDNGIWEAAWRDVQRMHPQYELEQYDRLGLVWRKG